MKEKIIIFCKNLSIKNYLKMNHKTFRHRLKNSDRAFRDYKKKFYEVPLIKKLFKKVPTEWPSQNHSSIRFNVYLIKFNQNI